MDEGYYLRGGKEKVEPKKTRVYVRLFKDPRNVARAVRYLKDGYTFLSIAKKMQCDRSTINVFYFKKLKEGVVPEFIGKRTKVFRLTREEREAYVAPGGYIEPFPVNRGKKTYADYAADLKRKIKEAKAKKRREAEKTITKLRSWRKKNGLVVRARFGSDWDTAKALPEEILPEDSSFEVVDEVKYSVNDEY